MKVYLFSAFRRVPTRGAATAFLTILLLAALPVTQAYAAAGAVTITVGAQSGALTYGSAGTADFTVTVAQAGQTSPSITLSVNGLPSGVTASWTTNPVAGTHSPGVTTTLHLATNGSPAWTPPGTYNFTVTNNIDANTGSGSLTIDTRPLTVTATGIDKTYDGTTDAAVTLGDDRVTGDDVSTAYTGAIFADMNANTGIAVSVSGISISGGAQAARYTLANTTASTSANITKATATIEVTPYNTTYDGSEHIATGLATGVEPIAADLSSLLDLSGTAHTGAGAYTGDGWTFAGDNNYFSDSGTVDDNIAKADADIIVTPYSVVYDGEAHTAAGTAEGVETVPADLSSLLDLSGTIHTGAGAYNGDAWTFAGNANYNSDSGTVDNSIAKADALINITPYDVTYDGAEHMATGTATGVETSPADLSSLLNLTGTAHTEAGAYTGDAWTFAGNANYNSDSGTVDDNIAKATPTLLVTNSPVTYDGSPHAASVSGSVDGVAANVLTGGAAAQTDAGTYAVTADFTPTDTTNYESLSAASAGDFTIDKATPTLSVTNSPVAYDGLPHAAEVSGSVPGLASNILTGGAATQTEQGTYAVTADFTPTDTTNYASLAGASAGDFLIGLPVFQPNPAAWDFSLVKTAKTSVAKSFVITNGGNAKLAISSVTLTGPNANQFLITTASPCAAELLPGESCSVAAVFKPTSVGSKTAALSFSDNAGNHEIALSGKGGTYVVLNGGLDTYPTSTARIPTQWTASNYAATDGKNTLIKKGGTASVKVANTAAVTKTLMQTRNVTGHAGDTLRWSAWAKGQNVPTTAGVVRAQVLLYNGTTLVQQKTLNFPTGTYAFTKRSVLFTASGAYTRVVVKLIYSKGSGTVWFDSVSLLRSP